MSKWDKIVKSLDHFFIVMALLCSAIFFVLLFGLFLDMAQEASKGNTLSFTFASYILVTTYFYWLIRGLWYLIKSSKVNKRWE